MKVRSGTHGGVRIEGRSYYLGKRLIKGKKPAFDAGFVQI
jgi:hypothetical protein